MDVNFTEDEQRFFGELFSSIDVENVGKVTLSMAAEVFARSSLPRDVIQKIIETCGALRLGHFGRSQFYLALKLIAAAQSGLNVTLDTFKSTNGFISDIPLPKFHPGNGNNCTTSSSMASTSSNKSGGNLLISSSPSELINLTSTPVTGSIRARLTSNIKSTSKSSPTSSSTSSNSSSTLTSGPSNTISIPITGSNLTPSSSPEPGTSPHGLAAHGWQSFIDEKDEKWNISGEEGIRLIEKEDGDDDEDDDEDEDEEYKSSDDEKYAGDLSSDDLVDIFIVTPDQLKYYCEQFNILTNGTNILSGTIAKGFFEKSKLPITDLSKIWILADQDKDGSLNLVEFCIAMHLVVLRRNSVDLPTVLPKNLLSSCNKVTNYINTDLLFDSITSSSSTTAATSSTTLTSTLSQSKGKGKSNNISTRINLDVNNSTGATSWTRFSPTSPTLISPLSKSLTLNTQQNQPQPQVIISDGQSSNDATPAPVNFDFQPVSILERDPKVIHPIARRLTPEVPNSVHHSVNGITSPKFPLPPPPPPRTSHRHNKHARSSSLDLNHISRANVSSNYSTLPPTSSSSLTSPTESSFHSLNCSTNFYNKPLPPPPPASSSSTASSSASSVPVTGSTGGSILYNHEAHHGAFTIVRKRGSNNTQLNNVNVVAVTSNNSGCNSPNHSYSSSSNCYYPSINCSHSSTCSTSTSANTANLVQPVTTISSLVGGTSTNGNSGTINSIGDSECNCNPDDTLALLEAKYSLPRQSFIPSNPNDHSELIRCMKGLSERTMRLEKLNEQLINELALVMRQNQQLESIVSQMKATKW